MEKSTLLCRPCHFVQKPYFFRQSAIDTKMFKKQLTNGQNNGHLEQVVVFTSQKKVHTVFPSLKPQGLIFFYFRIASFINEQGLIRIITILPIHVPYHVQEFGNHK